MWPAARDFCVAQDIFSQEYWRISRKNDAAHRKKARCPGALGIFRYTLGSPAHCLGSGRSIDNPPSDSAIVRCVYRSNRLNFFSKCSVVSTFYHVGKITMDFFLGVQLHFTIDRNNPHPCWAYMNSTFLVRSLDNQCPTFVLKSFDPAVLLKIAFHNTRQRKQLHLWMLYNNH